MKSYWVSIVVGAFMRWLNPTDASAWRRMVWWSGCLFSRRPTPQKKTGPNDPHKSIIKNIKYHQISLVHLFTCSIETISSTPNHKHYTIIYHTQFRHGKNLSDYRWQDRQVNELLIASRNTFLCFKSFRYDLPTGRVCKDRFPYSASIFFLVYWGL